MCRDTLKAIQNLKLVISHQMGLVVVSRSSVGQVIPISQALGYWRNLEKMAQIPQIMCRDIQKVFNWSFNIK